NPGTIVKKAGLLGTGTTRFQSWNLEHSGVIDIQDGEIELRYSGNEPHRILKGARLTGGGRVRLMGGVEPPPFFRKSFEYNLGKGFSWEKLSSQPAFLDLETT